MFEKSIHTEIIINSKPGKVWSILTDTTKHTEWNPFLDMNGSSLEVGQNIVIDVKPPGNNKAMRFTPKILSLVENKELIWEGKAPLGSFTGKHIFQLEEIEEGKCRFIHGEEFSGWLVPMSGNLLKRTEDGFKEMNIALKERAENYKNSSYTDE